MKSTDIIVVYLGVTIRYDEAMDRWEYELRGRERHAPSLSQAKESIAKPAPKNRKPFTRIKALLIDRWGDDIKECVITSVAAERRYGSGSFFWVSVGKERSTYPADELALDNVANRRKLAIVKRLCAEAKKKSNQAERIKESMKRVSVPKEEE